MLTKRSELMRVWHELRRISTEIVEGRARDFPVPLMHRYIPPMHFGYLIKPGEAQTVAQRLQPLVNDLRGNVEGLRFNWQRKVPVGTYVFYADMMSGTLTRKHPETGAVLDRSEFTLAAGTVETADDGGLCQIGSNDVPTACILGPVAEGIALKSAVRRLKDDPERVIVDHCLCWSSAQHNLGVGEVDH